MFHEATFAHFAVHFQKLISQKIKYFLHPDCDGNILTGKGLDEFC